MHLDLVFIRRVSSPGGRDQQLPAWLDVIGRDERRPVRHDSPLVELSYVIPALAVPQLSFGDRPQRVEPHDRDGAAVGQGRTRRRRVRSAMSQRSNRYVALDAAAASGLLDVVRRPLLVTLEA